MTACPNHPGQATLQSDAGPYCPACGDLVAAPASQPTQRSRTRRKGAQATPRARVPTEHEEQCRVIAWARANEEREPRLRLLFAIPNGGHRHPATAGKLKAEGVKPGVPDLFLAVSSPFNSGMFIEMKRAKGGRLSPGQKEVHTALDREGYDVAVCLGADDAIETLRHYLGMEDA